MIAKEAQQLVYSLREKDDLYQRMQKAIEKAVQQGDFSVEAPYCEEEDGTNGINLLLMDGFTVAVYTRAGKMNLTVAWKP